MYLSVITDAQTIQLKNMRLAEFSISDVALVMSALEECSCSVKC